MQARMKNPAMLLPGAMQAIQDLKAAVDKGGVAPATLNLVHLRVSQINGCSPCVHSGSTQAKKEGETDERLFGVSAWRESPFYTDAERAALALAEAVTRLSDRPDPVPNDVWEAATNHYNEREMATLLLSIAISNTFNRLNVPTHQIAGAWG